MVPRHQYIPRNPHASVEWNIYYTWIFSSVRRNNLPFVWETIRNPSGLNACEWGKRRSPPWLLPLFLILFFWYRFLLSARYAERHSVLRWAGYLLYLTLSFSILTSYGLYYQNQIFLQYRHMYVEVYLIFPFRYPQKEISVPMRLFSARGTPNNKILVESQVACLALLHCL